MIPGAGFGSVVGGRGVLEEMQRGLDNYLASCQVDGEREGARECFIFSLST
jgi:hypothetical protein